MPAFQKMNTSPYSVDDLVWFLRIAEAGSLSRASRLFDVPKSTLSQRLSRLEDAGGVALAQRSSRSFQLTQAGRHLVDEAGPLVRRLESVADELLRGDQATRGVVRMSASGSFGKYVLLPLITEFLLAHPQVSIETELTDRRLNLLEQGMDLAVRIGSLPDSGLKARSLGSVRRVLCAGAAYVQAHGLPAEPSQLASHSCLVQSRSAAAITLDGPAGRAELSLPARWVLGPSEHLLEPVRMGLGIAALPEIQVAALLAAGELRRVLPQWQLPLEPVHLVYTAQRHQTAALRTLIEHLVARVPGRISALLGGEAVDRSGAGR